MDKGQKKNRLLAETMSRLIYMSLGLIKLPHVENLVSAQRMTDKVIIRKLCSAYWLYLCVYVCASVVVFLRGSQGGKKSDKQRDGSNWEITLFLVQQVWLELNHKNAILFCICFSLSSASSVVRDYTVTCGDSLPYQALLNQFPQAHLCQFLNQFRISRFS